MATTDGLPQGTIPSDSATADANLASVARLKARLAARRADVQGLHRQGGSGLQVGSALSDACDEIIRLAYMDTVEARPLAERQAILNQLALVAVGGYGRVAMAPYSDVDLLFLSAPHCSSAVRDFVSHLVRTLWDVGLKLSQSTRSPADSIAFARQDCPARTALFETRLLVGSQNLYIDLQRRIQRLIASYPARRLADELVAQRVPEHQDYFAETIYLLEPNVKKSPGGLRDLHVLRWLTLARFGTTDPELLRLGGVLTSGDAMVLSQASESLHRIRNELHYHAGMAQDVLSREEQVRIAEWLGFRDKNGLLGVERFMRQYYLHTTQLHDLTLRIVDRVRDSSLPRAIIDRLTTHRTGRHYLFSRRSVRLDRHAGAEVVARAETALELFDLARGFGSPVAHETLERLRAAAPICRISPETRTLFLNKLGKPSALGDFLRHLHRVGLLGRLVPAFEHTRCLIQFSLIHKYTVDEHQLRSVEAAARRADDRGPLGQAYREIHRKEILHLALLLHDAGKGFGDDHCEMGARIARQTAEAFNLPEHDSRLLVFLVHQHLLMAHTAFRRDLTDMKTLVQFARAVGTLEALRMLYVMTAADTEAVSPGEWTGWKDNLLNELYLQAAEILTGEAPVANETERLRTIRAAMQAEFEASRGITAPAEWITRQLEQMPLSYLMATDSPAVAAHLQVLRELAPGGVRAIASHRPETRLTEYTVITWDGLTPGLFSKMAGVLAANGIQIASAHIVTRDDGIVIDTFHGLDADFDGRPPAARLEEVTSQIEQVLLGKFTVEQLLARRGASATRSKTPLTSQPAQVEIDNESSGRFTVFEIFTDDHPGLLYDIAHTLFELGLSVHAAKIATHVDQVVDVFYVSDSHGRKVTDADQLEAIRDRLLQVS